MSDLDLGMALRQWRERGALSVEQAAEQIGVTADVIERVEAGAESDMAAVGRILDALERDPSVSPPAGPVVIEILETLPESVSGAASATSPPGGRLGRIMKALVVTGLVLGLLGALLYGWRARTEADGLARDLDIAKGGIAILDGDRESLEIERDDLAAQLAAALLQLEQAETSNDAEVQLLAAEIDRLLAESEFLRKAIVVSSASAEVAAVGVTFDGDPAPGELESVLDVLAAEGAAATFFPSGIALEEDPEAWSRALEEGHELGNPTYSRVPLDPDDPDGSISELAAWDAAAEAIAGPGFRTRWFRPPGMGGFEDFIGSDAARSLVAGRGLVTALWSIETWYALYADNGPQLLGPDPDAAAIADYVVGEATGGDIILLQFGSADMSAVPAIIRGLAEKGLEPGTLSQLIDAQEAVLTGESGGGA